MVDDAAEVRSGNETDDLMKYKEEIPENPTGICVTLKHSIPYMLANRQNF